MRKYVDTEKLIGEALLFSEKLQTNQDKVTIHTIVCRDIFCPLCGRVMDSKKSAMFEMKHEPTGRVSLAKVLCSVECIEKIVANLNAEMKADWVKRGLVSRVVDAKQIWKIKRAKHGKKTE